MNTSASIVALLIFGLLGTAAAAPGPQAAEEDPSPQSQAQARLPGVFQIATRAQVLADSAAQAERRVQRLATVGELTTGVEEAEDRYLELQALLESMVEADFVRLERLSRLRDQAVLEDGRLEAVRGSLIDRLVELGDIHEEWLERRELWTSWLEALRPDADFEVAEPDVMATLQRIDEVLEEASASASLPLTLQGRVEALLGEIEQLTTMVTTIQGQRRQALLERTEPILFSRTHLTQLRDGGWRAWDPTAGIEPRAYLAFVRSNLGMLGFHALLAILIGAVARAARMTAARKKGDEWSGLLAHPWALGVFASVVIAMTRITLAPPLWDVLLWSLFGATAAILAPRLVRARALRLTAYLLAVAYPVFLLLEVARLPEPVFRVGLALVAACAIPLFLLPGRDGALSFGLFGAGKGDPRLTWPLRLGAGIWTGVLLALLMGFDALARWAVHATVMSAAVVFTVMLGFVVVGNVAATLSRLGDEGPLLRRGGVLLAQRMLFVLRIALIVMGALVFLDVWGLTGSPVATWQRIMEAGFTVGTLRLTVGRILLGVLVVYLAVLVSGLVRSLVMVGPEVGRPTEGVGRLLQLDRGVGESITRLAQYAFVAVGVIVALGVMGVELQNFAIVAGALGVGVGFGLQNVVNNFASGLILLFERPVRVGDTVVVNDVWGSIQKIGLRSTVMVTLDESEMIVPNADLVSEKVINWTLTSARARMFLPVGVAYGSPIEKVLEILGEAAFAHPTVLNDPPPQTLFMGFGDSSLDFELRVWLEDITLRMQMRSVVLADIERRLREAGIEIPFPQRDLHLRSVDAETLRRLDDRD